MVHGRYVTDRGFEKWQPEEVSVSQVHNSVGNVYVNINTRRTFKKFLVSPHYSESELCGGAVTVSFSKRCTSYNAPPTSRKRDADRWSLGNFLPGSSLFMAGKAQKSHGARTGLYDGCSNGAPPIRFPIRFRHTVQISPPCEFWGFQTVKRELRGSSWSLRQSLRHVFEKWVERCKKCIACQGTYFEKETVTVPRQSSESE
jgi:hypothetical protein